MRAWSCVLLALTLAVPAFGHELLGPPYAIADLQGHFKYNVSLVVTSTTELNSTHLDGSDNTDVDVWIDGFCVETMVPGTIVIEVDGNLINDSVNGAVVATVNLCDDWTGFVATTIVPYPVANEDASWGTLKSLYH